MKDKGDRIYIKLSGKQVTWLNVLVACLAAGIAWTRYHSGGAFGCAVYSAIAALSLRGIWMERKTQAIVRERWAIEDENEGGER